MTETERAETGLTAFRDHARIASGGRHDVALALFDLASDGDPGMILIFEDATGRQIDLDLSGRREDVARRFAQQSGDTAQAPAPERARGRGRPRLGVVGREVTLLPRHWEWLQTQRGGPSATLRRLVDQARTASAGRDRARQAQDAINRFISAVAGDLPGFEEANRALYRGERERFEREVSGWPADVRRHLAHWSDAAFVAAPEDA